MSLDITPLLSLSAGLIFFVLALIFVVYGAFLAYHWFSYGTKKRISLVALAAYLSGGAILLLTLSILLGQL